MIPSPIRKALSTIRKHRVDHLLMGGQACVLYGAAEFSRDVDLALLPDPANLDRLTAAMADLQTEVIAVPPFNIEHLDDGLAIHFRCLRPDVRGLRIDVMTRMRGVAVFPALWRRRTTFEDGNETLEVLSLPDLVASKKTQRDKDWPMIRRLVEVNYMTHRAEATQEQVDFWLRELRTPELLLEAARAWPERMPRAREERSLVKFASDDHLASGALGRQLRDEEEAERLADAAYWRPLRKKLQDLRHETQRLRS